MSRHPAGKGRPNGQEQPVAAPRCDRHVVRPGETLWEIAAGRSDGKTAEIPERVNAIHRANARTIGPDPDLILPGQVLSLPGECAP